MTKMTPRQMRELADRNPSPVQELVYIGVVRAALRTAADQFEAVRQWAEASDREPRWDDLDAILKPVADAS